MNHTVPEIVRIGVGNARIKCVTRQRVEYFDEAEQECFVDLDECASVLSQKYDYIVWRVFGRWNLLWLSMRRGGSAGCSFR